MSVPGNILRSLAKYFTDNGLTVNLVLVKTTKPESDIFQMDYVNMYLDSVSLDYVKGTYENQMANVVLVIISTDEDIAFTIVQNTINLLKNGICKMYNFDSDPLGVEILHRKLTWVIEDSIAFENMPSDEEATWMNTFTVRYIT